MTPPPLPRLLLATHNAGKLAEFRVLLAGLAGETRDAGAFSLPEPEENGGSFTANALIKARAAAGASGWPALADDSGLCINALDGAPGVDTANWSKRGRAGLTELYEAMGNHPDRSATCVCVLALVWPDGREQIVEGRTPGMIVWPPRGTNGFGYDSIFQPDGQSLTYAEMPPAVKNTLSHRVRAFAALAAALGHEVPARP